MRTNTPGDIHRDDRDLLGKMAELEPGWASSAEVGFVLGGDDPRERQRVRQLIKELARCGALKTLWIRHRGEPMLCVLLDPTAIRQRSQNEEKA